MKTCIEGIEILTQGIIKIPTKDILKTHIEDKTRMVDMIRTVDMIHIEDMIRTVDMISKEDQTNQINKTLLTTHNQILNITHTTQIKLLNLSQKKFLIKIHVIVTKINAINNHKINNNSIKIKEMLVGNRKWLLVLKDNLEKHMCGVPLGQITSIVQV